MLIETADLSRSLTNSAILLKGPVMPSLFFKYEKKTNYGEKENYNLKQVKFW